MGQEEDELSVQWQENGVLKIKELDRRIFKRGSWATGIFLFQELQGDGDDAGFSDPKVSLRRYRRRGGRYQVHSKFVLSSGKQAREVAETLDAWFPREECPSPSREGELETEKAREEPTSEHPDD